MMIFFFHLKFVLYFKLPFFSAKTGTQIVIPYRGTDEDVRHLRVMGDLGQIVFLVS